MYRLPIGYHLRKLQVQINPNQLEVLPSHISPGLASLFFFLIQMRYRYAHSVYCMYCALHSTVYIHAEHINCI